ncbi:MAG: NADP-dependent malic enzyme [Candidatus Aenigmarchaeota archaeon]|nr:NADP-dependent malic enzyme [Candidatus Aenigmarchaeota archaeon]
MSIYEESLQLHKEHTGKIAICGKVPLETRKDLSLAYTPGVAAACREIAKNKDDVYTYTFKGNAVAVVSDGSAVLGLGNIGPEAGLPVMEGKALIFKEFANIDAIPVCLGTQNADEIVQIVKSLAPTFGGINLEDISAPRCFDIEARLQDIGIPVMHDDQHGTSVVVLAGLLNAAKVVAKPFADLHVVINGAGAAGTAIARFLINYGLPGSNLILCDSKSIIVEGRPDIASNPAKQELARLTNRQKRTGSLEQAIVGADVFLGLSVKDALSPTFVKTMARDPIIFAMANPDPEIMPDVARAQGAAIVATGRSDFPNQANNALGFPGIFRGALDVRAKRITMPMKIAAAEALAGLVPHPTSENILPAVTDRHVVPVVAHAVARAWQEQ